MASLPNSSVDFPQNSLEAIGKDFIGRERSASPEPVDLGSPEGHDSNIDTIDFDPGSRGVGKSPGHSHTPLRGRNISRDAQSPVHDLGDSTSASHVARSDDTRPFVHFSPDSKVGSGDSYGFDRSLKRNSTNITNASASLEETRIWDQKAILSLDGGGIRGYSELLIIRELMRAIGRLERAHDEPAESSFHPLSSAPSVATDTASMSSKTLCEAPVTDSSPWLPCHYFDYMAGTSTGGLISIMLGRLRMSIDDCIHDYERFGDQVFGHSRWFHVKSPLFYIRPKYNHKVLEKVVKDVVEARVPHVARFPGGRNFAFDENRCRTVVLSYQRQKTKGIEKTYLFRTYKNLHRGADDDERLLDRNPGLAHDVPIWKVARATSAAPGYFETTKINDIEYLDGGFGANNPCIEIYDEVRKMNNKSEDFGSIIISIGTGKNNSVNRFVDGTPLAKYINYERFARKWATNPEGGHHDMLKKTSNKEIKFLYRRFNVEEGLGAIKLDEWRVRGPVRIKAGSIIGSLRPTTSTVISNNRDKEKRDTQETHSGATEDEVSKTVSTTQSSIPNWLQPRNKTLESITKYTEDYLSQDEVQKWIKECAELLVKIRRLRASKDPQRWEKCCFGAWYQCNIQGCKRAEKEYDCRDALERHLLDKHRDLFRKSSRDREELNKTLNDCKIVVH